MEAYWGTEPDEGQGEQQGPENIGGTLQSPRRREEGQGIAELESVPQVTDRATEGWQRKAVNRAELDSSGKGNCLSRHVKSNTQGQTQQSPTGKQVVEGANWKQVWYRDFLTKTVARWLHQRVQNPGIEEWSPWAEIGTARSEIGDSRTRRRLIARSQGQVASWGDTGAQTIGACLEAITGHQDGSDWKARARDTGSCDWEIKALNRRS